MRGFVALGALAMLSAGCGFVPHAPTGPQLVVTGPSDAVHAFVRAQGAHRPSRAATYPETMQDGRSRAVVMMPAGTGTAVVARIAREAVAAGLSSTSTAPK